MSEHLCTLSTGDKVYFYDKSIVIYFQGARKVLSTSLYNGGYHDDYTAVYNYDAKQGAGMPCEMLADTYVEHMQLISKRLALDPAKVSGMGTAASMENAVVETVYGGRRQAFQAGRADWQDGEERSEKSIGEAVRSDTGKAARCFPPPQTL